MALAPVFVMAVVLAGYERLCLFKGLIAEEDYLIQKANIFIFKDNFH